MKRFVKTTRGLAVGLALIGVTAQQSAAQFVTTNNFQAPPAAARGYASQPVPAYAAPPQANYAAPAYAYPRVAQTAELPSPAEALNAAAPAVTPAYAAPVQAPAPTYAAPVSPAPATMPSSYTQPTAQYAQPTNHYTQPTAHAAYPVASSTGCASGNCGTPTYSAPVANYSSCQPAAGCDTGSCYTAAPACDIGCAAPAGPRRQWFAGIYGLYLDRADDASKRAVAYMTDTAGWAPPTPDYYPTSTDPTLFTSDAGRDGLWGAEIRFGSTFGSDPCACSQPFAWEVGYWALDDDSSSATLLYPGTVEIGNTQRIYQIGSYGPLNVDLDGAGATWVDRPFYGDDGMPASRDLDANDVRIVGVRVRQRFQAQNLELNFWRFGTPTAAPSLGGGCGALGGACGGGACGAGSCGAGSCGVSSCGPGACGSASCAPCRPPRRFFINGLAGIRYLRVDDDFGLDQQFTLVDTDPASPTYGDPPAGWPTGYESFPVDDNSAIFSDYEADNELVGFQLGCSMNWLVGCRWNVFADTNFGIYGNNAEVYKRVYGGGDSYVTFANGGGAAAVRGSETNVAFVGELRAGLGYQVSCNCRLTAAYRFFGIGGVALGGEEFQNTVWTNAETASHIDTNNSIVLHGLQTGVEYKY